jgi:hypothetical protein
MLTPACSIKPASVPGLIGLCNWSIADLLRGDFKQSQYGRIILPFTLLRRLECVLAPTKPAVLAEVDKLAKQNLPEEAREKLLLRATGGLSFFNTSRMDLLGHGIRPRAQPPGRHARLSKIRQQDLMLSEDQAAFGLKPGEGLGTAKARDPKEEFLSQIISRLNELFVTDHLTEKDLVNYAYTVRDKVRENATVMKQLANNSDEQAQLGDFPKAVDDAILDSSDAHENQKLQLLSDPKKAAAFAKLVFDLLKIAV